MKSFASTIPVEVNLIRATAIKIKTILLAEENIVFMYIIIPHLKEIPPLPEGLGYRAHVRPPSLVTIDVTKERCVVSVCIETSQLKGKLPDLFRVETRTFEHVSDMLSLVNS